MEAVAKSEIFFFITTVCIILVTLVILVSGVYLVKIVADVKSITKRLKEETAEVMDDLKSARESLKEKGRSFASVLAAIFALRGGKKKRHKTEDGE